MKIQKIQKLQEIQMSIDYLIDDKQSNKNKTTGGGDLDGLQCNWGL